jgi:adenylate cyclase
VHTELLKVRPSPAQVLSGCGVVLVVDDEEQNRTLLHDRLEARGYQVIEAENGLTALHAASERLPDVILLDVMMPNMDGFEVCRLLKGDPKTAHIPILMVTALSDREERLMGIGAGANDFLNKPVDFQDVILRVGNAVYTKRLFDELHAEQQKGDRLLLNILPQPVAARMKKGETTIVERFAEVTVMFADLVGFTTLAATIGCETMVYFLNEIFSRFDALADKHGLEKIKTIGDAYMVVAGIPTPRRDHAEAVARLALQLRDDVVQFNEQYETSMNIRIGIHTGPVVAGVIGRRKFAYDVWGDTVNVASRLESLGEPGRIQVSEATYERLGQAFQFEERHSLQIKGRSEIGAWWLRSAA